MILKMLQFEQRQKLSEAVSKQKWHKKRTGVKNTFDTIQRNHTRNWAAPSNKDREWKIKHKFQQW